MTSCSVHANYSYTVVQVFSFQLSEREGIGVVQAFGLLGRADLPPPRFAHRALDVDKPSVVSKASLRTHPSVNP